VKICKASTMQYYCILYIFNENLFHKRGQFFYPPKLYIYIRHEDLQIKNNIKTITLKNTKEKEKIMGITIANIKDANLKRAAQEADSQGQSAYNGILDKSEVSLFLTKAKEFGCSSSEALEIAKSIGFDKQTAQTVNKMQKLEQINKLEKTIAAKKALLKEKTDKYYAIKDKPTTAQKAGRVIGAAATEAIGVGGVLMGTSGPVGWAVAAVAATCCWLVGYLYGDWIGSQIQKTPEYDIKVQQKTYEDKELKPLKQEIAQLETALAKKKAELQN